MYQSNSMRPRMDLQRAAEKKMEERIDDCKDMFPDCDSATIYHNLKNSGFIQISAPQEAPPVMQMLTMSSLGNYSHGSSIKPGNILLNIRQLMCAVPGGVTLAYGMSNEIPLLQICAALQIWKSLVDAATIQITKEQAFVIVALWKNCDAANKIVPDKGFDATNALLSSYGESALTMIKYNHVIDSLVKLGCIALENNIIRLRERIRREYISSI